ncbi:ABC transporter permease subunit [Sediminibacterium sp.]|uniref:carbohydrate ABC transporter permease n=1 Tax=Sediminibacterium sp. TaxID=1917865 RepID=UPI002D1FB197|nr:ABC transporter permease subunit [Sediminibacterium sp.]
MNSPNNKDSIADFLVINKTLDNNNLGNTKLDQELINEIAKQSFTESVGVLNPSRFKASIQSISNQFPFYTDISFESVPSSFIDVKNIPFTWDPNAEYVPVIVPNMFLDIYNFQFSISQNLPQLTPSIVKMIVFKLTVYGKNGPINFNAKIVGLSDRISSMLVPAEFIQWGNNYAEIKSDNEVSRLVVFKSMPFELEEAAMVDGCTRLGAFLRVVLPLSLPGLITVAIFSFLLSWTDYTYALIMIGSDANKTVPVGLASMVGSFDLRWGEIMAGSTLIALPLFGAFALLSQYFIQGLGAGAVKG